MAKKLFVGGLSWNTTTESLKAAFEVHGPVPDAIVMSDRETGQSRGFGFVTFANDADADKAVEALNGTMLDGRPMRVDVAADRPAGGRGPGGPGGFGGPRPGGFGGGPRGPGGPGGGFGGPRPGGFGGGPRGPGGPGGGFGGPRGPGGPGGPGFGGGPRGPGGPSMGGGPGGPPMGPRGPGKKGGWKEDRPEKGAKPKRRHDADEPFNPNEAYDLDDE